MLIHNSLITFYRGGNFPLTDPRADTNEQHNLTMNNCIVLNRPVALRWLLLVTFRSLSPQSPENFTRQIMFRKVLWVMQLKQEAAILMHVVC